MIVKGLIKTVSILLASSILGIGVVGFLLQYSTISNHHRNPFIRLIPPHFLTNAKLRWLPYNSFYLAGLTQTGIFLGNRSAPAYILRLNYNLTDTISVIASVPNDTKIYSDATKVVIDSPAIFMLEGLTPKILVGDYNHPVMTGIDITNIFFNQVIALPNHSFAIRFTDPARKEFQLAKLELNPVRLLRRSPNLTSAGDGIFSRDGNLVLDRQTGNLVYVYFYRNQYLLMDPNLNILSTGKTIDSVSTPQIKVSSITSEGTKTFSTPPLTVNFTCCVDSGRLYINSKLRAMNEAEKGFFDHSVIDVYSLENSEYLYSFYVPDFNGIHLKSFQVYRRRLIVMYNQSIVTFQMQY